MADYQTNFGFELAGKARPNKPNPALLSVLDKAATSTFGPGSRVVVFSGQEDPGNQYGSIRHKTGLAADVRVFRPDGSQLRLRDEDAELFAMNVKRSGARGFGAGDSYMGDAFHIDLFPEEDYTSKMGPIWGDWAAQRGDMLLKARAEGNDAYNALLAGLDTGDQRTEAARRAQYGLGDRNPGSSVDVLQAVQRGDMTKDEAGQYVSEGLLEGLEGSSAYDLMERDRDSLFDRIGVASSAMQLAQPQPVRVPRMSMEINRGQPNAGSRALQRMGIASLA